MLKVMSYAVRFCACLSEDRTQPTNKIGPQDIEMNTLAVTTLEASFKIYDMRSVNTTDGRAGHSSSIFLFFRPLARPPPSRTHAPTPPPPT